MRRSYHPVQYPEATALRTRVTTSKQQHAKPASLFLVRQIVLVHAASNRWRPPIVQIVMQLSITGAEFEVLQKERVVVQGQGIEDVELGLLYTYFVSRQDLCL